MLVACKGVTGELESIERYKPEHIFVNHVPTDEEENNFDNYLYRVRIFVPPPFDCGKKPSIFFGDVKKVEITF